MYLQQILPFRQCSVDIEVIFDAKLTSMYLIMVMVINGDGLITYYI